MPVVVESSPQVELPPHKLWTREECDVLEASGVLDSNSYELIGGELLVKMTKKLRHMRALLLLAASLRSVFGEFRVVQEASIDLPFSDSERSVPEPDIALIRASILEMTQRPQARDLMLAVEISDSTLNFDLGPKASLYARAGIPEYWVLDLNNNRLIVHRDPVDGAYHSVAAYLPEESVSLLSMPEHSLAVSTLL